MRSFRIPILAATLLALAGCGNNAFLPKSASYGPNPILPPPQKPLLPVNNTAPIKPWKEGQTPTAALGWTLTRFAPGWDPPRWIQGLPTGKGPSPEPTRGTPGASRTG